MKNSKGNFHGNKIFGNKKELGTKKYDNNATLKISIILMEVTGRVLRKKKQFQERNRMWRTHMKLGVLEAKSIDEVIKEKYS